jgi:hypothetical protein
MIWIFTSGFHMSSNVMREGAKCIQAVFAVLALMSDTVKTFHSNILKD